MPTYGFAVGPAWPTERSAYDYLLSLTHPGWAWEPFGGRTTIVSPQKCTAVLRRGCCPALKLCGSREPDDIGAKLRFGACPAFAAPDLPAPLAPVLWLAQHAHPMVHFAASHDGLDHERDFDITQLPFAVHVHFDANGRQYVVLKSATHHVTCLISGALVTAGAVRAHFTARSVAELSASLGDLGILFTLFSGNVRSSPPTCPARSIGSISETRSSPSMANAPAPPAVKLRPSSTGLKKSPLNGAMMMDE